MEEAAHSRFTVGFHTSIAVHVQQVGCDVRHYCTDHRFTDGKYTCNQPFQIYLESAEKQCVQSRLSDILFGGGGAVAGEHYL